MARYLLDESRSLELFAGASVWDDFPSQPGQVRGGAEVSHWPGTGEGQRVTKVWVFLNN
jgi:hypothetical protein